MAETRKTKESRSWHWRKVIAEWGRSGLTQRAFCRQRRIPTGTLSWWKHHLSSGVAKAKPSFVAVSVRSGVGSGELAFPAQAAPLEVRLSDGTQLLVGPGCDAAVLERVLRALREGGC